MGETTRLTEEGRATIPEQLREKYDLRPGDEIVWTDTGEGIIARKRTDAEGRGLLLPDDTPAEKREAVAEELAQRLRDRRI